MGTGETFDYERTPSAALAGLEYIRRLEPNGVR